MTFGTLIEGADGTIAMVLHRFDNRRDDYRILILRSPDGGRIGELFGVRIGAYWRPL